MKLKLIVLCLSLACCVMAQKSKYSTYYYQRSSLFETLSISSKDIIFLGNSITDGGEWFELFQNTRVKNRGISGDTTEGVYDRLGVILKGKPNKIFLLIGVNDLGRGVSPDSIVARMGKIMDKVKQGSPQTQLYVQSILPTNNCYGKFTGHTSRWNLIPSINAQIKQLTIDKNVGYIDLYTSFANKEGKMHTDYSNDGLHLMGAGYQKWVKLVKPYINN